MAELDAVFFVSKARIALVLVVTANPIGGGLQRLAHRGVDLLRLGAPDLVGEAHTLHVALLEALGELHDRRVATLTDVGEDRAHRGLDALEVGVAAMGELRQARVVRRIASLVNPQHRRGVAPLRRLGEVRAPCSVHG
ncbi:MAG: hypothetical protein R3B99_16230 [Polyangiales bacterium]